MNLENICCFTRILLSETSPHISEEGLASKMATEKLFLKWPSRPVGEDRILDVEHTFVQESHGGEYCDLYAFVRIAETARLLHGMLQRLPNLAAKGCSVLCPLQAEANAHDCREDLLKRGS